MGAGGGVRGLCGRRGERGPHQPRGHLGPGRQAGLPLAQGGAVHGGPGAGGVGPGAPSSTSSTTTPSPASRRPSTSPGGRSAGRPTRRPPSASSPPSPPLLRLQHDRAADRPDRGHGLPAHVRAQPGPRLRPRFFAWLAGWGQVAFPGAHGYFWVPIVGPLVGGVLGAIVYDLFVGDVLRARGEPPAPDVEGGTVALSRKTPAKPSEVEAHLTRRPPRKTRTTPSWLWSAKSERRSGGSQTG
jgi:hypothetical protein